MVDGREITLREALTSHYDVCKVTPNLVGFVAEHCPEPAAAKRLRNDRDDSTSGWWTATGSTWSREFAVRADPELWQEVLVRLTPRQYSISSSPLVSPHEVQLTVSVVRYRGADGGPRGGVALDVPRRPARLHAGAGLPAALAALPAARRTRRRR